MTYINIITIYIIYIILANIKLMISVYKYILKIILKYRIIYYFGTFLFEEFYL